MNIDQKREKKKRIHESFLVQEKLLREDLIINGSKG